MEEKATPDPKIKRCSFCGSVGILEEVESEDGYRWNVYCINSQYCGGTTNPRRSAAKAIEFLKRRFSGRARGSHRLQGSCWPASARGVAFCGGRGRHHEALRALEQDRSV